MRTRLPTAFEGPVTPGAIQQQIEAWQPVLGLADWDWDRVEHQLLHVLEGAITGRPMVMWSKGEATWTKPWWLSSDEKTT